MSQPDLASSNKTRRLIRKMSAYATVSIPLYSLECCGAIIHTDFGAHPVSISTGSFDLDLNQDSAVDFVFLQQGVQSTFSIDYPCSFFFRSTRQESLVRANNDNSLLAGSNEVFAGKLGLLALIDPLAPAVRGDKLLAQYGFRFSTNCTSNGTSGSHTTGMFASFYGNLVRGFLGLQFEIDGSGRHAAWADIDASPYQIVLHSFAYETIPGKPIPAGAVPEPSSLFLLAAGAVGVAALRQRRSLLGAS